MWNKEEELKDFETCVLAVLFSDVFFIIVVAFAAA